MRQTVRTQLQGMADDGAPVIRTAIWFGRTDRTFVPPRNDLRFGFPPSAQELANLRQ